MATNATPEQIRPLFRRARIIGRRFQLVHVVFGQEIIETSTFRAPASEDQETDEHGRILRDNVFGSQAEDAARRDFTMNALYYDPHTEEVIDYHHGVSDLKKRQIRMIGDPAKRYREDPVRMLRAVRFAAKLNGTIDPATRQPIGTMADLIENVPASRLFDEMLKLLTCGHAMDCLRQLRADGLHKGLLPLLDVVLEQPGGEHFVELALERTDARVRAGKTISPSFLFAALLWQQVEVRWKQLRAQGEHTIPALSQAADSVLDEQTEKLAIQRRFVGHARNLVHAAALRAPHGQDHLPHDRTAALPRRLRFPAAARRRRRVRQRAGAMVDGPGQCRRRPARRNDRGSVAPAARSRRRAGLDLGQPSPPPSPPLAA